ncbi:hypothetical protein H6G86_27260 [Nostoc sp. FACHB-133]|nr:hypothetical protein [Nostoc sp. FACHB-133]
MPPKSRAGQYRLLIQFTLEIPSGWMLSDIAERIFCATRKETNLFTRNILIDEELAQGDVWRQAATRLRTGNTFKNLELCSDRTQLTLKASLGHDVLVSISQC